MVVQQKFVQSTKARLTSAQSATFIRKYRFRAKSQASFLLGVKRVRLTRKMTQLLPSQSGAMSSSGLRQSVRPQSPVPQSPYKPLAVKRLPANRRRCTNFPMIKGARRC